ncbi:MAG: disulfide reductase [Methanosarcinales archaeon]|nr:disulfide reductase [Methanosarcinales archaeon]
MKLAYYPGCVARSTGKEYELSTRAVCSALGVELEELEDWNCCGATHCSNELLAVGLAARNLSQTDLPIMASCSICYSNLRIAAKRLEDHQVREKVNSALDKKYSQAEVKHVLEVLAGELMGEENQKKIVVPLKGLKVAPYYGCLLTRPKEGMDSPENPRMLEKLIAALQAEPVNYPYGMLCCGGPIFMAEEDAASESAFRILHSAKAAGADAVVAVCPLCHLMLDAKQRALENRFKEELDIPILYVTQLAGIALGLGPEDLGMEMNSVSPTRLVEEIYERLAAETEC